jgi:Reverse transcriptase (RNA-dependent DNA polymerase)
LTTTALAAPVIHDMVERGYFPKELPPAFTPSALSKVADANGSAFDTAYTKIKHSHPCRYQLARPGSLKRTLAVPNPAFYYKLAAAISSRWAAIESLVNRASLSISKPKVATQGRAIQPTTEHGSLFEKRCEYRSQFRFILHADINQFYPALYTHSIPWATEGKAVAKRDRSPSRLGNLLDKIVQNSQDGQTKGIPIGPDCSLVIAELLLSACDADLCNRLSNQVGFRYFDDYELYFDTRSAADEALSVLEAVLSQYELILNPSKTRIETVLQPLDHPWSKIRSIEVRERDPERQRNDLVYMFDEAFAIARQREGEHVLKYTIGRLNEVDIHGDNLGLYFRLLSLAVKIEHATLPLVLNQMLAYKNRKATAFGKSVSNAGQLTSLIHKHILAHALQGNSSEVAWAVWGAIAFTIELSEEATRAICLMEDSFVALLALYAHHERRLVDTSALDDAWWKTQMDYASLRREHWLLSYEAVQRGWLRRAGSSSANAADKAAAEFFDLLYANGVSFLDNQFGHTARLLHAGDYGSAAAEDLNSTDDIRF